MKNTHAIDEAYRLQRPSSKQVCYPVFTYWRSYTPEDILWKCIRCRRIHPINLRNGLCRYCHFNESEGSLPLRK